MISATSALKLSYEFHDTILRDQALTHRSAAAQNNERLEFLGDSIVNYLVAETIFQLFPGATEGQFSRLRAQMVRQESLAEVARQLDLGAHLILGAGEMKSGARRRDSLLSDALEALIAAIYLDSDMATCKRVVMPWFSVRLSTLTLEEDYKDAKTLLQEWLQARNHSLPRYELLEERGPDNQRIFRISCRVEALDLEAVAESSSKKQAELKAAAQLLDQIKSGRSLHE